jgi:hypothetical protein
MHGRMPPQNVVSSRMTSTAGSAGTFVAELLEVDDDRIGRESGIRICSRTCRMPFSPRSDPQ